MEDVMAGLRWPHQTTPRGVGNIVDDQVRIWTLKQDERPAPATAEGHRDTVGEDRSSDEPRSSKTDRLGFRYWSDAIATELIRLMHIEESAEAYLMVGLDEAPKLGLPPGTQQPGQEERERQPRRRRRARAS
jgi:hypothetical protein